MPCLDGSQSPVPHGRPRNDAGDRRSKSLSRGVRSRSQTPSRADCKCGRIVCRAFLKVTPRRSRRPPQVRNSERKVAQRLSNSCSGTCGSAQVRHQHWPTWANFWSNLANFDQGWPTFGICRPRLGRPGPRFGQRWPMLTITLAESGCSRPKFCRTRAKFGRFWANFGRAQAEFGRTRLSFDRSRRVAAQIRPGVGKIEATCMLCS